MGISMANKALESGVVVYFYHNVKLNLNERGAVACAKPMRTRTSPGYAGTVKSTRRCFSTRLHRTAAVFSTAFALLPPIRVLRAHADAVHVAPVAQLLAPIDVSLGKEADARIGAVAVRRAHRGSRFGSHEKLMHAATWLGVGLGSGSGSGWGSGWGWGWGSGQG